MCNSLQQRRSSRKQNRIAVLLPETKEGEVLKEEIRQLAARHKTNPSALGKRLFVALLKGDISLPETTTTEA